MVDAPCSASADESCGVKPVQPRGDATVLLALLVSIVCVLLCVAVHLGLLLLLHRSFAATVGKAHRTVVGWIVLAAILGHLLEISLFAVGYVLIESPEGTASFDLWYHSASAYTSLGDSQLGSAGWRLMTTVEALTGLVLITWTASFTFLVMQRNWELYLSLRASQETAMLPPSPASTAGHDRARPVIANVAMVIPHPFRKETP
jgi:hypothetical protein